MVVGEGEKMPAALIQPNFEFVEDWAKRKKIELGDSKEDLVENKSVIERIQEEVDFYNERFGKWERIKRFELTPEIWSVENDHLTPTMKMKRKVIKEKYMELYNRIYEHPSA
jgi:long-chain acyl-CoA synthetase